jgi:uncharacterized protein DUF1996
MTSHRVPSWLSRKRDGQARSDQSRRGRHRGATKYGFAALAVVAAVTSISYGAVSTGTAEHSAAKAKIQCKVSTGQAFADPIVFHNATGKVGHQHTFFGNNALLSLSNPNAANYTDLAGKPTNCENTADTAGYWTPTLIDRATGKPVPVAAFTAYYRSFDHKDFGTAQAFPADTRLIAKPTTDTRINNWSCGQFDSQNPVSYIPKCSGSTPGNRLTAHVTFPSCWDGVRPAHRATDSGLTSDSAHYAYPTKGVCPAGFPNKVTELRETIQYNYAGDPANLVLASDAMMGTSQGRSLHADFWNTWDQAGFERMVRDCITGGALRPQTANECG